jgi:hypothetical protein
MNSTLDSFGNPLTIVEYLSIIKNSFIVPLNLLQKKVIFEAFSSSHCLEYNLSNCLKYILPQASLICLQIV